MSEYRFIPISGSHHSAFHHISTHRPDSIGTILNVLNQVSSNSIENSYRRTHIGIVFTHKDLRNKGMSVSHPASSKKVYQLYVYLLISSISDDDYILDLSTDLSSEKFDWTKLKYDPTKIDFVFFDAIQLLMLCLNATNFFKKSILKPEYNIGKQILFSDAEIKYGGFAQKSDSDAENQPIPYGTLKAEVMLKCGLDMSRPAVSIGVPCPIMWGTSKQLMDSIYCQHKIKKA